MPDLHFCVSCGARSEQMPVRLPAMAGPGYPPPAAMPMPRPVPVPPRPMPTAPPMAAVPMAPRPLSLPPMGYPAPVAVAPRRSNGPWIVAGVAATVAVVLVALGVLATLRPASTTTVAVPTPVAVPTVTVGVPVASSASSQTSTGTDPSSGAAASLQSLVETNRSTVEGVVGSWVPQLSAKRDGTRADGITYDDASILSHYSSLAARYPSAALLWSGDWPVFNGSDYWVVIYPQSFTTADAANAWCDAQGFAADDCLAKKLSHTGGPAGTTKPRS